MMTTLVPFLLRLCNQVISMYKVSMFWISTRFTDGIFNGTVQFLSNNLPYKNSQKHHELVLVSSNTQAQKLMVVSETNYRVYAGSIDTDVLRNATSIVESRPFCDNYLPLKCLQC